MTGVVEISEGERTDRRRRVVALLATGVIVAAAAGLLWNVADRGATPTAANDSTDSGEAVPWDGGLLDEDRLTLYFTGARPLQAADACSRAYEAVAEPTDDTLVVTVRALAGPRLPPVA